MDETDYAKLRIHLNDGTGSFTHSAAHDLTLDKAQVGGYQGPAFNMWFYDKDGGSSAAF